MPLHSGRLAEGEASDDDSIIIITNLFVYLQKSTKETTGI